MNKIRIKLINWHKGIDRELPWKKNKSPYKIWLSEVLLQQTRVNQAIPYYRKFLKAYPTIEKMASASLDEVMKLWQGLGYYSRAKNMHETSIHIVKNLNSEFPNTYNELLKLKGVGNYTAAAIASFAYNEPKAVVDGNVFRVLSRYFGIETPIDSTAGKKEFQKIADEQLDKKAPGIYNQAIMDFGALQCIPKNPSCNTCCFKKTCKAHQNKQVALLPVKAKKLKKRIRYFNYFIIHYKKFFYLQKREEKDIWQNLFQYPLIESDRKSFERLAEDYFAIDNFIKTNKYGILKVSKNYKQQLTHQQINARFIEIEVDKPLNKNLNFIKCKETDLKKFAYPKIIDWFLKDKVLN